VAAFGGSRIGAGAYVAIRSILAFNTLILLIVAVLLVAFMEHPAGLVGGAVCCLGAGMTFGAARWLDRLYRRG
jgi:hypothetical protein